MQCLLNKKVRDSKTSLIEFNSNKRGALFFLFKIKGKLGNSFINNRIDD